MAQLKINPCYGVVLHNITWFKCKRAGHTPDLQSLRGKPGQEPEWDVVSRLILIANIGKSSLQWKFFSGTWHQNFLSTQNEVLHSMSILGHDRAIQLWNPQIVTSLLDSLWEWDMATQDLANQVQHSKFET